MLLKHWGSNNYRECLPRKPPTAQKKNIEEKKICLEVLYILANIRNIMKMALHIVIKQTVGNITKCICWSNYQISPVTDFSILKPVTDESLRKKSVNNGNRHRGLQVRSPSGLNSWKFLQKLRTCLVRYICHQPSEVFIQSSSGCHMNELWKFSLFLVFPTLCHMNELWCFSSLI